MLLLPPEPIAFLQDMRRETAMELKLRLDNMAGAGPNAVGDFVRNRWLVNIQRGVEAGFAPDGFDVAYKQRGEYKVVTRWRYQDALLVFSNLSYDGRRKCSVTGLPYWTSGAVSGVQGDELPLRYRVKRVVVVGLDVVQRWPLNGLDAPPALMAIREVLVGEPAGSNSRGNVTKWKPGAGVLHNEGKSEVETPVDRHRRGLGVPIQVQVG